VWAIARDRALGSSSLRPPSAPPGATRGGNDRATLGPPSWPSPLAVVVAHRRAAAAARKKVPAVASPLPHLSLPLPTLHRSTLPRCFSGDLASRQPRSDLASPTMDLRRRGHGRSVLGSRHRGPGRRWPGAAVPRNPSSLGLDANTCFPRRSSPGSRSGLGRQGTAGAAPPWLTGTSDLASGAARTGACGRPLGSRPRLGQHGPCRRTAGAGRLALWRPVPAPCEGVRHAPEGCRGSFGLCRGHPDQVLRAALAGPPNARAGVVGSGADQWCGGCCSLCACAAASTLPRRHGFGRLERLASTTRIEVKTLPGSSGLVAVA
jgi:hypothetical protein